MSLHLFSSPYPRHLSSSPQTPKKMARRLSLSYASSSSAAEFVDSDQIELIDCPFVKLENLSRSDLRETAYELFFMSCRSSPGFGSGGKSGVLNYHSGWSENGDTMSPKGGTGLTVTYSRIKKVLGLKKRSTPMRTTVSQTASTTGGATGGGTQGKVKRPMTSAEIMRLQMRVTEQSDTRLRKTLMRTFVGQVGRRAETIILPLELLRQLKPSEFNDGQEYHQWQRRQLKIIETGLLLYPSIPLDKSNKAAIQLRELLRGSDLKPIDNSKNSEAMQTLCDSVVSLAWRSTKGSTPEVCHWADSYPLNVLLYISLLQSIFDMKEETVVLDEVDELVELIKKTWPTLGIDRMIHNVCFSWVLFQRYIETGQVEKELLSATTAMLVEVANDAKRPDHEVNYAKTLFGAVNTMQDWAEKRLLDYHESFENGTTNMDSVLALGLATMKVLSEVHVSSTSMKFMDDNNEDMNSLEDRVSYYIKSSVRNALTKSLENRASDEDNSIIGEAIEDPSELLVRLATDAEVLALREKEKFSPTLKKWHPVPTAAAAVTIHNCFGLLLNQYLSKVTSLTSELVRVLQAAGKLEKVLLQIIAEDTEDYEDDGQQCVREMVPYEVETIVLSLLKSWINERLKIGKECLIRAKETESWMPKSKTEPYAQSAVDIMRVAKVTVDEFFEIPVGARDEMIEELANGLESIFQEYTSFVASCGMKQSYIPTLPPLTRCNQDSIFTKLWKLAAAPCHSGASPASAYASDNGSTDVFRPSTSRGTQRLYIRLNTLHYVLAHLHALDKSLSFFSRSSGVSSRLDNRLGPSLHFSVARSAVNAAIQHVGEVAAYRLIFLDSQTYFYDGALYAGGVVGARIRHCLRTLKHNLTLLVSVLVDRAQPLAVKEVMKASFEAFLMVLLAGGTERAFLKSDHVMVVEDFKNLKTMFSIMGEGLVAEDVVDREAEVVEGVLDLMGLSTEQLIEEFSIAACESSGIGGISDGCRSGVGGVVQRVPMPPTTGRWSRGDPNTVLRVLCYRDDDVANQFLKTTFQLAKRK